jgi:hypothetical protein
MLSDERYREWVVRQVKDPVVRSFWRDEFSRYDWRFMRESIAPIQNKVGQLLMAPPVRNIFGQIRTKIDPAFMMDNRRIFIANLSKGKLGADKANLIGAVLVTQFQLAAMARAHVVGGATTAKKCAQSVQAQRLLSRTTIPLCGEGCGDTFT